MDGYSCGIGVFYFTVVVLVMPNRPGRKKGSKRSDKRWEAPDGTVWDSGYEYDCYRAFRNIGYNVTVCYRGKGHTFNYVEPTRGGQCMECGSTEVFKHRSYTPDFYLQWEDNKPFYVETKGYWRPSQRALFQKFLKSNPELDVRIVLQSNAYKGKLANMQEYVARYMKIPSHVWSPVNKSQVLALPEEWKHE